MLTDENSEIACRLSTAAKRWARMDPLDHIHPLTELALLLDVINELNARRLRSAELEADLRDTLRAVLHHFGPEGAHKVTTTVIEEQAKR